MNFKVEFVEKNRVISVGFGAIQNISDGGYERGYSQGYADASDEFFDELLGGAW